MSRFSHRELLIIFDLVGIWVALVSFNLWTDPLISDWFDSHDSGALRVVRLVLRFCGLEGAPLGWYRVSLAISATLSTVAAFLGFLITQVWPLLASSR